MLKLTYKKEGIYGFYKGMGFPLSSIPLINAITFGSNEFFKKKIVHLKEGDHLSDAHHLVCGLFSGFVACSVMVPSELVKCKLQMQFDNPKVSYYHGVFDCISKEYNRFGIKGLYKGFVITALRDGPAIAAQFVVYNKVQRFFKTESEKSHIKFLLETLFAGGCGGFACWLVSYPQDTVKTFIQTCTTIEFKPRFYDGGVYECAKYIYQTYGIKRFWKGFIVTGIREKIS